MGSNTEVAVAPDRFVQLFRAFGELFWVTISMGSRLSRAAAFMSPVWGDLDALLTLSDSPARYV